ncbi:MAG: toll/interleukin-1 receptor domain-containing protein [Bacteroidaceae bacterium]|nr:toll/interleukin-1 receptor domain-containing protein [Bacteroidaceae bacterium]
MNKKNKYDVFISYSRKDYVFENRDIIPKNNISRIKETLTNAGISYWFDEECINYGEDFINKVVNNIKSSKIFIFLSTENANKSTWTRKEICCADEFKKIIIPVRIDATPYDERIMFRISDLNYIEYYKDPDKALVDLADTINKYLEEIEEKEKRELEEEERRKEIEREKAEKLRQQKEEEEKRKKDEEQQTIVKMQRKCMTLHNVESRLELGRQELLVEIGLINDVKLREELREKIINGGPIHQKYQQKFRELTEKSNIPKKLIREINDLRSQIEEKKKTTWSINKHFLITICFVLFVVGLFCGIIVGGKSHKKFEIKYISVLEDSVSVYKGKLNSIIKLHSSDSVKFVRKLSLVKDSVLIYKNEARKQLGIATTKVVDLGLSVKWAGWNIGATAPEEYGDYYAWGETTTKSDYSWSTYIWCKGNDSTMTKYCTNSKYGTMDKRTILEPSDDVAYVKWGGSWRMPTNAEQDELCEKCEWEWTALNGVKGYKVTGPSGNSIFLPAAGFRNNTGLYRKGVEGVCWSSSLYRSTNSKGYVLFLDSTCYNDNHISNRCNGRTVRPVCK